jgi:arylsulfatase A
MKNIYISVILLILAFFVSCIGLNSKKDKLTRSENVKSPNIIFILTDDQGWNHVSHHSDPKIPDSKSDYFETPNMDLFAESGLRFTHGYAPNPICAPTRNSIIFGQNAARHIYNKDINWIDKTGQKLTIPKVIKMANSEYKTAHFGKWHVAMHPGAAGYDAHDGLTGNDEGQVFKSELINAREYNKTTDRFLKETKAPNPLNLSQNGKPTMYWNEDNPKDIFGITKSGIKFMDESISQEKPFYLQLSHYATHLSFSAKKESYEYFKKKKKGKVHESAEFGAMLLDMDKSIGMVMDFVKEKGIADNTYIFIMSDNGGRGSLGKIAVINSNKEVIDAFYPKTSERNTPLRDGKHSFYEGGLRVPFMVSGPNIEHGKVSEVPVTGLDLLPTFYQLAGGNNNLNKLDGGSLVNLILNKSDRISRPKEALIFHQGSHRKPASAIIKNQYKLIKYWEKDLKYPGTPRVELYNIYEDPFENNDLIDSNKEIADKLLAELLTSLEEYGGVTEKTSIESGVNRAWRAINN